MHGATKIKDFPVTVGKAENWDHRLTNSPAPRVPRPGPAAACLNQQQYNTLTALLNKTRQLTRASFDFSCGLNKSVLTNVTKQSLYKRMRSNRRPHEMLSILNQLRCRNELPRKLMPRPVVYDGIK